MEILTDYNYGADSDGNRGILQTTLELDDSQEERNYIASNLYNRFKNGETLTSITYDDIEIDIDINDYIDEFINEVNQDEDLNFEDKIYLEEDLNIKINNPFLNKYEISWDKIDNSNGGWNIKIGDISISDNVFEKEMTNYDCVDVQSAIEDLDNFINEKLNKKGIFIIDSEKKDFFEEIIKDNNPNNKELISMIETLKKLRNSTDKFVMISINDGTDVIFPSTDFKKFKECCDDILEENEKINKNEKKDKNINNNIER